MTAESSLRGACLQMEPRVGEKERNVARSLELIRGASDAGAGIVPGSATAMRLFS